jgi:hypothetical protein
MDVTDDVCPNGCNLRGDPIPEEQREWFGNHTHFSRRIGIYDMNRDRTVEWACPDCNVRWPRV